MSSKPNIIILILDALRAKNLSAYGHRVKTTRSLDAFASDAVLFRRAFSTATWTIPSHASILTGLYTSQHRIESIEADRHFHESIVTLPNALRSQGYRTVAFSQNILFAPSNHLDNGFDEFYSVDELLESTYATRLMLRMSGSPRRLSHLIGRYLRKMTAPHYLMDSMLGWISAHNAREPFFLMANVLAPHFPWAVPLRILLRQRLWPIYLLNADFVTLKNQWEFNSGKRQVTETHRRVWRHLYDACIMHVDQEVGRFLNRLRQWNGWKDTIVVITSDHGEMLGDYRDIVGHMLSLHDNLIHVPMIVSHPHYPPGTHVEAVVQTLDLYPSALEWAGVPADRVSLAQLQRPSLSQAVAACRDTRGFAFAEEDYTDSYDVIKKLRQTNPHMSAQRHPRHQIAVRTASHKYIWHNDGPGEFYNLVIDPGEVHNLIDGKINMPLRGLQNALEAWRSKLELFPPRCANDTAEMNSVVVERLRALGYVL